MKCLSILTAALVAGCLLANTAGAAVIPVACDPADTQVGKNLDGDLVVSWSGNAVNRTQGNNYQYNQGATCTVMVFELPDLGGEDIESADLTFSGYRQYESTWNVDLYGVRSAVAKNVTAADYGYGPNAGGTLIQNDIMTPAMELLTWTPIATDGAADVILGAWLADQYDAVGAGGFVFLRVNSDDISDPVTSTSNYQFAAAENTSHATPVLTITTVPEPASMSLLALGDVALVRRKR